MLDARARSLGVLVHWRGFLTALLVLLMVGAGSLEATAKARFSAIAVDARTGKVLFSSDPDGQRYPASLTKVMTLYVLFQELKAGRMTLSTKLKMSKRAAGMAPSKLGVKPGQTISAEDAIKALVTLSANDVAAMIGENISGSESAFAARMTKTARALGMSRTTFKNASGLPNPGQVTTARDMATLSLRVQKDFPQYYPYFKMMSFNYKGRVIRTHNRLLGRFEGTDGIKTGYIRASGFNLTSSVKRGDKRIIGVVMGGKTGSARNNYMISMLSKHLPKCKDGKTLAASISGAPAPKEMDLSPEPEVAIAAAEEEELETPAPAPQTKKLKVASTTRPSDKTVAELSEAAAEEGDNDEDGEETLVAEIPPQKPKTATMIASMGGTSLQSPGEDQETVVALAAPLPKGSESMVAKGSNGQALPFAVKGADDSSAWQGKVLVAAADLDWNIQIGAFPNKQAAQDKLRNARKLGVDLLDNKEAFTVQVQKGNEIVYRARFSGFSEDAARAACRELTEKGIGCVAVAPQS